MKSKRILKIENWGEIDLDILLETVKELKQINGWTFRKWKPTTALIDKTEGTSWQYVGQTFDPNKIELVQNGWTHDHCEICNMMITDTEEEASEGYNSENRWICNTCWDLFMKSKDLEKELLKYQIDPK